MALSLYLIPLPVHIDEDFPRKNGNLLEKRKNLDFSGKSLIFS